jgi:chromosome segregation ATPase
VSRKFSQTSNNTLQNALESLKVRHAATTATLNAQIDYLQRCLFAEKRMAERLRMALDDLSEEISRETYGRRREISLRLACLGREENLAEHLRRWHRKAREYHQRASSLTNVEEVLDIFGKALSESDGLLDVLDGELHLEDLPAGSLARIIAARDAAGFLSQELQVETDRRMQLERYLAHIQEQQPSLPTSTEQLSEIEEPPPGHVADLSSSDNLSSDAPPIYS